MTAHDDSRRISNSHSNSYVNSHTVVQSKHRNLLRRRMLGGIKRGLRMNDAEAAHFHVTLDAFRQTVSEESTFKEEDYLTVVTSDSNLSVASQSYLPLNLSDALLEVQEEEEGENANLHPLYDETTDQFYVAEIETSFQNMPSYQYSPSQIAYNVSQEVDIALCSILSSNSNSSSSSSSSKQISNNVLPERGTTELSTSPVTEWHISPILSSHSSDSPLTQALKEDWRQ
jgi:hypothetical protein